jgi:hypothetical protein
MAATSTFTPVSVILNGVFILGGNVTRVPENK